MKKRECNNPVPKNTDKGCEGSNIEFGTCKDDKVRVSRFHVQMDKLDKKEKKNKVLRKLFDII